MSSPSKFLQSIDYMCPYLSCWCSEMNPHVGHHNRISFSTTPRWNQKPREIQVPLWGFRHLVTSDSKKFRIHRLKKMVGPPPCNLNKFHLLSFTLETLQERNSCLRLMKINFMGCTRFHRAKLGRGLRWHEGCDDSGKQKISVATEILHVQTLLMTKHWASITIPTCRVFLTQ